MARSSTTYAPKWKSGKTTVIRVPSRIADDLLDIAKQLDQSENFWIHEDPAGLFLEFKETRPIRYQADRPINVSSVPQRSPFRYPGGKTWFVPYLRDWMLSKSKRPGRFIEPFAGGAVISLTVAFERLAKHVIFGELDPGVAAVWRVVLNGQAEWLAKQIQGFELTAETVRSILAQAPEFLRDLAFQTILRNRVQRGGIMAAGAGLAKVGENGRGLLSRWYPETLSRRIREINHLKDRMTFVEGDGFVLLEEHKADKEACYFIDPPYTLAARRLYTRWQIDHRRLFAAVKECKGDFLMTYDNTPEIVTLAKEFEFHARPVAMKNTHHAKMTELLIGRDLSWLDRNL